MSFTDIFVRRPVLSLVVSALIIVAGLQAIAPIFGVNLNSSISVRQYPRNDNAVVKIETVYIGASAELVRGFVTTPLERVISSVEGVEYISSSSTLGLSTIEVRLKLNYDSIKALSQINTKINQVRNELPDEAEVPVINVESADSRVAAAYLSFTSDILDNNQITDFLVRVVQPRLSAVAGVQRADVLGGRNFAMRIWLKPQNLAAYNITPVEVRQALAANNFLSAPGNTKGATVQVNLSANTNLETVDEFKQLVIRTFDNGAIVRLKDIADVELGSQNYRSDVRFSGQTATFMGIWPLPNANSLDVLRLVREEMEDIQKTLPSGMQARIAYDSTKYIDASIKEVVSTLVETLLIVILVIFLFLGSLRSVMVPVIAIPISLLGAVFLIQLMGFSINLLTLLAIVLSVGLVVDDAIVIVENVQRHISEGKNRIDAALQGARELVGPVISTTAVLVAVYLPVGLQGGLTGSLFKEFAFTLAGAVIISSIVALTLSPMMSGAVLRKGDDQKGFALTVQNMFESFKGRYLRWLDATLASRPLALLIWVVISILCIPLFSQSATELAPTEDQGVIFSLVDDPANANLDQAILYADATERIFSDIEETDFVFQLITPGASFGGLVLEPWDQRERTVFDVLAEVRPKVSNISGIRVIPVTPPALPGGGDFPVELLITSTDNVGNILDIVRKLSAKGMQAGLFPFPPIIDTKIDQPQAELVIDRNKVADLGLTLQQVGRDVGILLGGGHVNRFNINGRSYQVIPQIKRSSRLNPQQLDNLYISGPDGQMIKLSTVASIRESVVPRSLNRFQQQNAVKMRGVSTKPLGETLAFLEAEAQQLMPSGYAIDYTGESRQFKREGNKFLPAFIMALLLIFMVLSVQFNSFRDPLVIIAGSVPLAMFGALIFVFLKMPNPQLSFWTDGWTTTLNIYSQVGLVTLIGLIAKNGILLVEFANKQQQKGRQKLQAIREAAATRLRPILMTSVATVAGHFPLILVTGAGAEARNSIGIVLVSGMAIGTFFTLFVIPSVYMLLAKDHHRDA